MTEIAIVDREALESTIPLRQGFWRASAADLARVEALVRWEARAVAELEPAWKQLIPYAVARRGRSVFAMERLAGGAEQRLHGRISVGVGGHIERGVDASRGLAWGGLAQEWHEEVAGWPCDSARFVGFINDDSTPVGAVHLGVVFAVRVAPEGGLAVRETHKLAGAFRGRAWLNSRWDRLESWSQLALSGVGRGAGTGRGRGT